MSKKVKVTLPKEVTLLPIAQREELIKSLAEQLQVPGITTTPHIHTSHDPDRDMWTPDEMPMIAALEDWFYGQLAMKSAGMLEAMLDGIDGLPGLHQPWTSIAKSFGDDCIEYLAKSDNGFRLGDIVRMQRKAREKLIQYVADGGSYNAEEIARLQSLLNHATPDFAPLLEAYAVRSVLLGKLKRVADENTLQLMGTLLARLPVRIEQVREDIPPITLTDPDGKRHVVQMHPLSDAEIHAVQHAAQHAAQYVTNATTRLKTGIQQVVTDSRRNREAPQQVAHKLLDRFGDANRDWRRIALTEITDAMASGYLASLPTGSRVMGQGAANACPHCQRLIIGKVYRLTDRPGDPETDVWVGKTNVGNKARDYVPTIPLHPHCRCRWVKLSDLQDVTSEGVAYIRPLEELIEEYKRQGLIHPDYTMDDGVQKGD